MSARDLRRWPPDDLIVRVAEIIHAHTGRQAQSSGKTWGPYPAAVALAEAGLLASPVTEPDDLDSAPV